MEAIQSTDSFFINGQTQNHTDVAMPAETIVIDDSTLLERTEGYNIHITRFAVDTQSTMFYVKKDVSKIAKVELMMIDQHRAQWVQHRAFTFTIDEDLPTLTALIHKWNDNRHILRDPVFPVLQVDGGGRFFLTPHFSQAVTALGTADFGAKDHMFRVQFSDGLSELFGFEKLTSSVWFTLSGKTKVCEQLDFLHEVVGENRHDFYLQYGQLPDNYVPVHGTLHDYRARFLMACRATYKAALRFTDKVFHNSAQGHQSALTTHRGLQDHLSFQDNTWCKIYWEESRLDESLNTLCQYFYVTDKVAVGNHFEYRTGGWEQTAEVLRDSSYGFSYGDDAERASIPWNKENVAQGANTRVFEDEMVYSDLLWGGDRDTTFITYATAAAPLVHVRFIDNGALSKMPQPGDMLEIPYSGEADGGSILELDIASPNYRGVASCNDPDLDPFGTNYGFEDIGKFYCVPILAVTHELGANGTVDLALRLAVSLPRHLVTKLNHAITEMEAADSTTLAATAFITQKRPGFIPKAHMHQQRIAVTIDGIERSISLDAAPVRVGDHIYMRRTEHDDLVLGPYTVKHLTWNFPVGHPPETVALIDAPDWPTAAAPYDLMRDNIIVVNQEAAAWYQEDIRRLKLMVPAATTLLVQTADWTHPGLYGTGHAALNTLSVVLKGILDSDELFDVALAPRPDQSTERREPALETFPAVMTTGRAHHLVLDQLLIESGTQFLSNAPTDRRYFDREGFVEGWALLTSEALHEYIKHDPNAETWLQYAGGQNLRNDEWSNREALQVCGLEGLDVVMFAHGHMFADDQPPEDVKLLHRNVRVETGGKVAAVLKKGNTFLTVEFPESGSGRPLHVMDGDFIRSALQGRVDMCSHFQSIVIMSRDIGVKPERSNTPRVLSPIISSYMLPPSVSSFSMDMYGVIKGYSETPYGTVTFSEGGPRRFHKLVQIPGDLRQFSINCALVPRDTRLPPVEVMLGPGEQFNWQIMFVKNF